MADVARTRSVVALSAATVAALRSAVVVTDVAAAAVELVQNALDAGATAVRVGVHVGGGDLRLDVSDDGTGIPDADADAVGRHHHTSKPMPSAGVPLYGFRGEALASLAEVALVTITSRTGACLAPAPPQASVVTSRHDAQRRRRGRCASRSARAATALWRRPTTWPAPPTAPT
jgi:DNA mismatch repair ATPase MutL